MLLKDKSPTVGGNVAGGTSSEAYSSLHAGTPSQHQGSLDEPETHDLQDYSRRVKCFLNVLFWLHFSSATSCSCVCKHRLAPAAQREPIEEQDGHHCAIIHTILLRHPGIASLIGWLLCPIRPHRWGPLICGQHRLYVCNLTNPMDLLKFRSPLEAAHPKVLRFLCCIMLFSTSLSLIWDLCILVIVFIWIWWSCDGHCHYCAILINW